MNIRKTGAGILGATALTMGGVDAAVLNETPLERIEIIGEERVEAKQIGDIVETKFPWKGEEGIGIKYDMGNPTIQERFADKRRVEVFMETRDEGTVEVGLILNQRPSTNSFRWEVEGYENYEFYYQAPLWQEAGLKAPTEECTDTDCDGAHRPENVVGSYAVYHKELKNHRLGDMDYQTGKAFHRYRPQAMDSNGNTVWGVTEFINGEFIDTYPDEWLDKAVYPVKI